MRVPRVLRVSPIVLCATIAVASAFWISRPATISASTESSMASTILSLMNDDRMALGLRTLRADGRLAGLANDRAAWMASTGLMSHESYGGDVPDAIRSRGVSTYSSGEAIGSTNAAWGVAAAQYLYGLWKDSPDHWGLMMSDTFNYVGVGVSQASDGQTFASLVFAEAPDSTRPIAQITAAGVSGRTVFFSWVGRDGLLQTHTAGLRDFDVQYRVDGGAWILLRTHTTTTQLLLANRPPGHTYAVRIRDRDRRDNLSPWTAPRSVRVP
jgi:uncharacterized protein YkwD